MCAATSEMCASIIPHHVMREEPLQPLLPLLLPRCNHAAPEQLGPSAAMIATPHLKSRFHPLPRGRGRRSYSRWERGSGERRAAAVCEGAGGGGGERDGGGDRKREGRCTVHDDGVVDLLWYYYSYVSQEAIIRSVQFSSPSVVFFQQTSSSLQLLLYPAAPWLWGIKRLGPK